jgi:hypothetical protein
MQEVMHRIDEDFAPRLSEEPGFIAYDCIDTGDNTLCTVSVFRDEAGTDRSTELAAKFVRDELSHMKLTRLDVRGGVVGVSRAAREVLEPVHS